MELSQLTESSLTEFLSSNNQPAVLAFHAPWSKPSRMMLPIVHAVAQEYDGLARFGLVDADHTEKLLDHFGILSLPTFLVFKQGRAKGPAKVAAYRGFLKWCIGNSIHRFQGYCGCHSFSCIHEKTNSFPFIFPSI